MCGVRAKGSVSEADRSGFSALAPLLINYFALGQLYSFLALIFLCLKWNNHFYSH